MKKNVATRKLNTNESAEASVWLHNLTKTFMNSHDCSNTSYGNSKSNASGTVLPDPQTHTHDCCSGNLMVLDGDTDTELARMDHPERVECSEERGEI